MAGYISEIDVVGAANSSGYEFIEVAVPAGTDVSGYSIYIYNADGTIAQAALPLGSLQSTAEGHDVYVVDYATSGLVDITWDHAVALVDDAGAVDQFISFKNGAVTATEGPAASLTSTEIGTHGFSQSLQSNDGGVTYFQQNHANPGTFPCFAPGTMIDTPDGPRAVETLRPGDRVTTLDHGPHVIRWTRSGAQPLEHAADHARPVLIRCGALGPNLPARDLIVSPQHRILVGEAGQLQQAFASPALAPAKSLTGLPGIRHMKGKDRITWIHFAFDRHEIVSANGCLTDSLLLGPMVVNGLPAADRRTLFDLYGIAAAPVAALNGPPARQCLTMGLARRQLALHRRQTGHLVAPASRTRTADFAKPRGAAHGSAIRSS